MEEPLRSGFPHFLDFSGTFFLFLFWKKCFSFLMVQGFNLPPPSHSVTLLLFVFHYFPLKILFFWISPYKKIKNFHILTNGLVINYFNKVFSLGSEKISIGNNLIISIYMISPYSQWTVYWITVGNYETTSTWKSRSERSIS